MFIAYHSNNLPQLERASDCFDLLKNRFENPYKYDICIWFIIIFRFGLLAKSLQLCMTVSDDDDAAADT